MKLKSIEIHNFRSLRTLKINIEEIKKSFTYCLLGINESGKSNILKAIDFYDSQTINFPNDFYDNSKPVSVEFFYELDDETLKIVLKEINEKYPIPDDVLKKIKINTVKIKRESYIDGSIDIINTLDKDLIFANYTFRDNSIQNKMLEVEETFSFNNFLNTEINEVFWKYSHKIISWRSTPEYLILDSIDLLKFGENPQEVSVPLLNCFKLIGIEEDKIKEQVNRLNTPNVIHNLQSKLGETVTKHIKNVWPEHPVSIRFQIDNQKITFLVEDDNVSHNVKTIEQRSDGFKQFISFLLTLSIENANKELEDTILLIDEPEVHLHPPAQINLLKELVKITSTNNNNIVFFATHSNYMIDKVNLHRSYIVEKINNEQTEIKKSVEKSTTYSEVNFEVFGICTNDYHNELYGYLEDVDKSKLDGLTKNKNWTNAKTNHTGKVSLATYIRHTIHHPENTENKKFTENDLKKSINTLRKLKYK